MIILYYCKYYINTIHFIPVPNVQWITPQDAKRNCPKHVEFRTRINLEISSSVGSYCKERREYYFDRKR